nr:hypothetical protein [Solimicrobium silvestre]
MLINSQDYFGLTIHAMQKPFGEISVSPGNSLHPPRSLADFPGTNWAHPLHDLSPFGLSWYFIAVRIPVLVAALALPDKNSNGNADSAKLPSLMN